MSKQIKVSLIGNPNTGKTSVFNLLTGLNQQVGNYPGITVEKKEGICKLPRGVKAHILDLPGTYSLNASSLDENVVIEILLNKKDKDFPDVAVVVSDIENLKRNLLLFEESKKLRKKFVCFCYRSLFVSLSVACLIFNASICRAFSSRLSSRWCFRFSVPLCIASTVSLASHL